MKTTSQTPARIRHLVKNSSAAIANRILQASVIITKYSYWLLSVFIFFSCQKNLTRTNESASITSHTEAPKEQFVIIDSAAISGHISSLSLSDVSLQQRIHDKVNQFYQANAFKTKWLGENGPTPLYYASLDLLKNATHCGLSPEMYRVDRIEQQVNILYKERPAAAKNIAALDIQITETFFLFAIHLREGRITDTGSRGKIWIMPYRQADNADVSMLALANTAPQLDDVVKKLQPAHEQYAKLQKQLIAYRSLEKSDIGTLPVSTRQRIKPAERHVAIPAIRKKLWLMDLQIKTDTGHVASADSLSYDSALVAAVKTFQQRHGLEEDGIIGGKTLGFLNQSFKEKADLIALNMERMRWLPLHDAAQYIRVNIPEYKLRIYNEGKRTLEMNVIVGAVANATPVFSDTLEYVVFSPTWIVPPSVAKEEILPRLKKNNTYYTNRDFTFYKKGVEIDPAAERWDSAVNIREYRIVQKPGRDNALGLAKFIMPNDMNIYLHDTPDHKPFSHRYRALSHGCIRLDDPATFAAHILQGEAGWDLASIKKAMTSGKPTKIQLRKQYEVHLEYRTVWVDDQGNLHFGEDIYGHDKRQLQSLTRVGSTENLVASR
ncbi:L,D-transpeptidase family protein [Fulvivirgaceae bacterium PWU4]|uniref:L,D-transpeptidase family protein n=1 Tax=Chryseosolibacter histidini TaxID=2782349 RepID=A0AAP2DIS0_9BACT|nr:L,D-transpeptidase family protein [Chryseosolibacter histidini]MBT1695972.1 L,D-transpeptidase family protein [Chryseosolibacter histidini]